MKQKNNAPTFYLITPAYNAESTLKKLLNSVINQSLHPKKWIIVDDGSTDATVNIISEYQNKYPFIFLERTEDNINHTLKGKSKAINLAESKLDFSKVEFVGILDSDIELPEKYFSTLLNRMKKDSFLGIAGGYIRPYFNGGFHDRRKNTGGSLAGAVQMFKTKCYNDIGSLFFGFPYGGGDSAPLIVARAKGWTTQTFNDLPVIHHGRVGGASGSLLKSRFRRGVAAASLGYHPLFMTLLCIKGMRYFPWIFGGISEFLGFVFGSIRYWSPLLDKETVSFFRKEQLTRLIKKQKDHT